MKLALTAHAAGNRTGGVGCAGEGACATRGRCAVASARGDGEGGGIAVEDAP